MALPATLPFAAATLGGERRRRQLARLGGVVTRCGRFTMAVIWAGFGAADALEGAR